MSALLEEAAALLVDGGDLQCMPSVEMLDADGGQLVLRLSVPVEGQPTPQAALRAVELHHELRYLQDLAQLRTIANRYDINPAQLEALLPNKETT